MTTDYAKIRKKIKEDYGKKGATKFGKFTSEKMYSDPTHFIFELLQNTEDALKLSQVDVKDRKVKFTLQNHQLSLSHNGKPFDEKDVISICEYDESSKKDDDDAIGKFGVGFKSVYRFTDSPKIFSGDESFEFRDYIYPYGIKKPDDLGKDETRIILPFNEPDAFGKIKEGLNNLCGRHILFLRYIKTLEWQVGDDVLRIIQEEIGDNSVRRVTITDHNGTETWFIFSQGEDEKTRVEIAFLMEDWKLIPYKGGKTLYSYFPIINQTTDLKFLVQGAFETTATREAIERDHPHNIELIEHAGDLLIKILFWFKKRKSLSWGLFDFLPIEDDFFEDDCLFLPMAKKIRHALEVEKLLPARGGGFVLAEHAKIPENKELMQNFDNKKISKFFGNEKIRWLQIGLSPKVKGFLSQRLEIESLSLFQIMDKKYITPAFMRQQKDGWVQNLYAFLFDEEFYPDSPRLRKNMRNYYTINCRYEALKTLPLIRLKGREHIPSHNQNNEPQVYLPPAPDGIKTVNSATIKTEKAKDFIEKLGIETYDDTNGLINEIRKRYAQSHTSDFSLKPKQYKEDIERIIAIQQNDKINEEKIEKFDEKLQDIRFVKAKNMNTRKITWKRPNEVYLATDNFKTLFSNTEVCLVHNTLMAKDISAMLVHYGTKDRLQVIELKKAGKFKNISHLSELEQKDLYSIKYGTRNMKLTQKDGVPKIVNYDIEYLDEILASFDEISKEEQKNKAKALWEALAMPRPQSARSLTAQTNCTDSRYIEYDAKFIHTLNNAEWIPAPDGTLKKPEFVFFDELKWELSSFRFSGIIQRKIHFKKSETKQAQERLNLDDEALEREERIAEIRKKMTNDKATPKEIEWYKMATTPFPLEDAPPEEAEAQKEETQDAVDKVSIPVFNNAHPAPPRIRPPINVRHEGNRQNRASTSGAGKASSANSSPQGTNIYGGGVANSEVEEAAIRAVQEKFSNLEDANDIIENNPGFDLYETDENGTRIKWVEVKGVSGAHDGIPTMTSTQYGFALGLNELGEGDKYIHITVAHALTEPEIHYVPNPVGKRHRIDNSDD